MRTAVSSYLGGRRFDTEVNRRHFITDHAGGGPTPPDLFVASISACIGIYVADYCEKVGLDATGLRVELTFDKSADKTRLVDFGVTVHLPNAAVGPRREAIRRVASACLIHETLRAFVDFPIEVRDAAAPAAA
jgi:uncharacterized OsmC-like protein